ncbi:winged helix-turn-helix transcriptional regulator [Candidatus Nanohaloarchaea archaeon]|nr:winged helix-turn-helix transcriptional regulator [Candidatus Nanohaloarchaea archaeon]
MRGRIERKVECNPGISFSELKESLEMANGQLQYHLRNADVEKIDKGYVGKGKCSECSLSSVCRDKCILGVLRDSRKKRIAALVDAGVKKKEISSQLGIDPSTLSYHINDLRKSNVLEGDSLRPEISDQIEF